MWKELSFRLPVAGPRSFRCMLVSSSLKIPLGGARVPENRPVNEWQDGVCASSRKRRLYQGGLCRPRRPPSSQRSPPATWWGNSTENSPGQTTSSAFPELNAMWHRDQSMPFERLPVEPVFRTGLPPGFVPCQVPIPESPCSSGRCPMLMFRQEACESPQAPSTAG
jgi:hypothetical protein